MYVRIENKDITEVKVDAIVCPILRNGNIKRGLIAHLRQKGGLGIETQVKDNIIFLREQRVPVTIKAGGRLGSKRIILVPIAFPPLAEAEEEPLPENKAKEVYKNVFEQAIDEGLKEKVIDMAFPFTPDAYPTPDGGGLADATIMDLLVGVVNSNDHFPMERVFGRKILKRIVFPVPSRKLAQQVRSRLRDKDGWSKARRLGYILDAVDPAVDLEELLERYFVNEKNYRTYLDRCVKEMKGELIKNTERRCYEKYGSQKELDHIVKFVEGLEGLQSTLRGMTSKGQSALSCFIEEEYGFYADRLLHIISRLEHRHHLLPYMQHLIPSEEWNNIRPIVPGAAHRRRKHAAEKKTQKEDKEKTKRERQSPRRGSSIIRKNLREAMREDYTYLVSRLETIRRIKGSEFPIDWLKEHWDSHFWRGAIIKNRRISAVIKEALGFRYGAEPASISKWLEASFGQKG